VQSNAMKQLLNRHKRLITLLQQKTGLSDYQILWLSFVKGVIVGIIVTAIFF
tara:strand:- start:176 stop:331 length:156 start_codon:yes stop_codon:yes gene_type:complete